MLFRPLTLARIVCRLDFRPKSILYYANRATVASVYYPTPYADWEYGPTALRQISQERRVRLTFEADHVALEADTPDGIEGLQSHFLEVVDRVKLHLMGNAKPYRLGWRAMFVLEHSSFDATFPVFNANTTENGSSWMYLPHKKMRDSAFHLHYGKESDGINMRLGVLTPAQASELVRASGFKSPPDLAIDKGALFVDLDRFNMTATTQKAMKELFQEHRKLEDIANNVAQAVLASHDQPGDTE